MSRKDLAAYVAAMEGLTKAGAASVVDRVLEGLAQALVDGERVELRGFGVFEAVLGKARKAHDIYRRGPVEVPAQQRVRFRPAKGLRERVAGTERPPHEHQAEGSAVQPWKHSPDSGPEMF